MTCPPPPLLCTVRRLRTTQIPESILVLLTAGMCSMCYSSSTRDVEHVLQYLQITMRLHSFEDEKRKIPALASCVCLVLEWLVFQPSVCSASPIFTCSYQRAGIYFSTSAPVLPQVWVDGATQSPEWMLAKNVSAKPQMTSIWTFSLYSNLCNLWATKPGNTCRRLLNLTWITLQQNKPVRAAEIYLFSPIIRISSDMTRKFEKKAVSQC